MSGRPPRWLAVIAATGLLAAGLSTAAATAAHASAPGPQAGPFEVGNLLDYANTDFEGTIGNWVSVSNAKLTDDTAHSFLHNDSLLDTASTAGTSSFAISGTPDAIKINLPTGGQEFRVGAYFKAPAASGQTVQFSLGCWGSGGYLKDVQGTPHTLTSTTKWQYSEDDITVPAGCTYVQGSPKVTLGGLAAGAAVDMDEVIFAPYRAALIVGAHGQNNEDGQPGYDAADWIDSNNTIGPLQSDKEFYDGTGTPALPSSFSQTNCYQIEQDLGASDPAAWPACVITYHTTDQTTIEDFVKSIPADQMVIMVFWNEPESNTGSFGSDSQCAGLTGGPSFVCEFDLTSGYVRSVDDPNVFVAEDSSDYQYGDQSNDDHGIPQGPGGGCPYIAPTTATDFYLVDHYNEDADGNTLPAENGGSSNPNSTGAKWSNWLSCVQSVNKPIGLGEYGLDCTSNPDQSVVTSEMAADNGYLEAIPGATEPTIMWGYWYSDNGNSPGCVFNNSAGGITQWKNIETQNGGG